MGGKWTSFRQMGAETVDAILKHFKGEFEPKYEESQTLKFNLIGSYTRAYVMNGIKRSID